MPRRSSPPWTRSGPRSESPTTATPRARWPPASARSTGTEAVRPPPLPARRSTDSSNSRGAQFTTPAPGTGFIQAPPSGLATTFNNATYGNFATFSAPRLFSPTGSTLTDVSFFVPGTNGGTPAATLGFGAVFSDVDTSTNASPSFFNTSGVSQGSFFAPTANDGLSFLGVIFPDLIGKVEILSGNVPLGASETGAVDIIVMDDFLYKEPTVVPEPTTLLLLGASALGLGFATRRRHAQR